MDNTSTNNTTTNTTTTNTTTTNTTTTNTRLSSADKLSASITDINLSIAALKTSLSLLDKHAKKLSHALDAIHKKDLKLLNKPKKERKPCGFALPSPISDDMCAFLGRPNGSLVSRIEITQFINDYIKKFSLENPSNKQFIIPNDPLWLILGNDARDKKLTHFTIQKYINKHFIKSSPSIP
jgi:chromatin remodeling complex protein RSC6